MIKRLFDIVFSLLGIIILSPLFVLIPVWIAIDSGGGIFYKQARVGKNNRDFTMLKFRTMYTGSDKKGLLTTGDDHRITRCGRFLRKYKLDELPQLFNILIGEMSFVGPRPEVRKYVELYTGEQKEILLVRPGLTDFASLTYFDEGALLQQYDDPEEGYVNIIMPDKLRINLQYLRSRNIMTDVRIILLTIRRIFSGRGGDK